MSAASNVIPMTGMYQAYIDAGFALCQITSGKGPTTEGWNLRENAITNASVIHTGSGVGLLHAYSAPITCALDIDNLEHAEMLLACHGIDRKSTRLNSSHITNSYAVFCLKKKKDGKEGDKKRWRRGIQKERNRRREGG